MKIPASNSPKQNHMQTSQRGKTKTTDKKHVRKSDSINTPLQTKLKEADTV